MRGLCKFFTLPVAKCGSSMKLYKHTGKAIGPEQCLAFSSLWPWVALREWYQRHLRKEATLEAHRCNSGTFSHHWSAHPFLGYADYTACLLWVRVSSVLLSCPSFTSLLDLFHWTELANCTYTMLGIHSVLQSVGSFSREIRYLKADRLPQQSLCKNMRFHNTCT